MFTEFHESPSRGNQPDYAQNAQWGDVIYGPNGRAMNSGRADYGVDPGMVVDMGNWNGDRGMIIRPSQAQMDMDPGIFVRAGHSQYDPYRGYDPRWNPNQMFGNNGVNVRLDLGPVSVNLGNGRRHQWMDYDNYNYGRRGGHGNWNEPVYRDRYGRPYQPDNYGWGNGSQWGRDNYGRGQWDNYGRGQQWDNYSRYDGYNDQWNDNYRSQQMQRMAYMMIMQMLQRQRQGQWGHYDRYGRDQYDRYGRDQYDRYGRDQYDRYGRDQYGRDQYGRSPYVVREPYGRDQYSYRDPYGRDQYGDRSWQQGRDQYGRPYDLDQYGWGQNGRDRYGRDQYGRYDQYDRYGRDQYGRYDQYDRYGRDQYDRYGRDRQYGRDPYWNQLAGTIQQMLGCSVRQFNRNVPENRGCATFVSAALRHSFNLDIHDTSVRGLEQSLRRNGFQQVDLRDLRPGDIIVGNRHGNQAGHAAIYAGDGQVAQNSSSKRRITVESANVFNSRSFQRVVAYRPQV